MIIGSVLDKTNANNPAVQEALAKIQAGDTTVLVPYNYTIPMVIFASLGVLALILGLWLKAEDKKKGYGLEEPNIK